MVPRDPAKYRSFAHSQYSMSMVYGVPSECGAVTGCHCRQCGQRSSSGSSRIGSIYVRLTGGVNPYWCIRPVSVRYMACRRYTDMDQDKDTRPDDRPTNSDTASDLTSFLEQRVRIPLDQSTSTQHSSSSKDVVFRVAQDRRRSPTNILPYQQRRSVDQR